MKYSVATIPCNDLADWQVDLLMQQLADLGFDSFEQDDTALRAYIPTDMLHSYDNWQSAIAQLSINCQSSLVQSSITECPDENWNAVWESEHEVEQLPLGIRIVPHCAFGAGHHETTAMMIDELMHHVSHIKQHSSFRVFDHGTGTGVLAIYAKRLGADYVLADDIDDNSVRNARENAERNDVEIDVRLSSADIRSIREIRTEPFNLILANIHRNILLQQMPDYASLLLPGGELWLSGFYEADIPVLIDVAADCDLHHIATRSNTDWRMLRFRK